ncbi:DUF3606 domain-containing protein [Pedobacter sp. SYSU D00535]|uniref:DUF3606 domain-containing protein n=1 Tax=Pedobacter sp. SYSU D00535 TaxID=2810308 RepID=UPI001A96D6DC|nr:DUF3606 domain-containing protein [Pedobacter sp. SYSU D00535]
MNNTKLIDKFDKELISMFAEDEVNYWATKWGVTKETLKSAVRFSGNNSVSSVYNYLIDKNKLRLT